MGLTAAQAQQVIGMIEKSWNAHGSAAYKALLRSNELALQEWENTDEYNDFNDAWRDAFGSEISSSNVVTSYSAKDSYYLRQWVTMAWQKFLDGEITPGVLHHALAKCGYQALPEGPIGFHSSAQAQMLTIALRSTKKNWGVLSPAFAEMAINLGLATNKEEAEKAVNTFMDALK
jgi:hypothetical protein